VTVVTAHRVKCQQDGRGHDCAMAAGGSGKVRSARCRRSSGFVSDFCSLQLDHALATVETVGSDVMTQVRFARRRVDRQRRCAQRVMSTAHAAAGTGFLRFCDSHEELRWAQGTPRGANSILIAWEKAGKFCIDVEAGDLSPVRSPRARSAAHRAVPAALLPRPPHERAPDRPRSAAARNPSAPDSPLLH